MCNSICFWNYHKYNTTNPIALKQAENKLQLDSPQTNALRLAFQNEYECHNKEETEDKQMKERERERGDNNKEEAENTTNGLG